MRILIISHRFPPQQAISAVRVGKIAKYLTRFGHDVRVVSAVSSVLPDTMDLEIAAECVLRTRWVNMHGPARLARATTSGPAERKAEVPERPHWRFLKRHVWSAYRAMAYFPDREIGWYPFAVRAARRLCQHWHPDLIYASGKPYTSFLVAHRLSRLTGVPWVAEYRDLWVDHHNYPYGPVRRSLEHSFERRVVATARGIVTVSRPLAEQLRKKHGKEVATIFNGYDAEDFDASEPQGSAGNGINIVHMGDVSLESHKDPMPLLHALAILPSNAASRVTVSFFGRRHELVRELAAKCGVEDRIRYPGFVPYRESPRVQREADILLLLLGGTVGERGVYTGKLFEYLGARRPILMLARDENVGAQLIRERAAGKVSLDHGFIARQLERWLMEKAERGRIAALPEAVGVGFTREEQTKRLEKFLRSWLHDIDGRERQY